MVSEARSRQNPSHQGARRALVIGVNGQDGSYLAEYLLRLGWRVTGLGRQATSRYIPDGTPGYTYVSADLSRDRDALPVILTGSRPDRVYHVAAIHGASGFVYEDHWQDALQVNVGSVHQVLEYIRTANSGARLLYASSVKAFDAQPPPVTHERLQRHSTCLYSITKNASADLITYYRRQHGARATTLFLFNHESPRRPDHYVLPRITAMLANAMRGRASPEPLRSLNFACDWGSSAEFMELGARLLEADDNQDYVMATGRTWTGLGFTRELFARAGLNWCDHVSIDEPADESFVAPFRADISRMISVLGHGPQQSAVDVAAWILSEKHGLKLAH